MSKQPEQADDAALKKLREEIDRIDAPVALSASVRSKG